MTPEDLISSLARHRQVFADLLSTTPPAWVHWSQDPAKWNLLQVACHLRDEEQEDFRTRLRMVLESPGVPFPGINPTGWVVERDYAGQDFPVVVDTFLAERDASLAWLGHLTDAPWDQTTIHPRLGPMSGRFILANWVAHDLLHIRQITRLHYDYLQAHTGLTLSYAGYW